MVIALFFIISLLALPFPYEMALFPDAEPIWFLIGLITHQFGHAGMDHLMGNFMFMLPAAMWLEKRLGKLNFAAFYLAGGALAALCQVGVMGAPLVGSSGAAFAILGGFCALFSKTRAQKVTSIGLILLLVYSQLNFLMASFTMGVAVMAHLGGLVGGHWMASTFFKSRHRQDRPKSRQTGP